MALLNETNLGFHLAAGVDKYLTDTDYIHYPGYETSNTTTLTDFLDLIKAGTGTTYASNLGTSSKSLTYNDLSPIYNWYNAAIGKAEDGTTNDTVINNWNEIKDFVKNFNTSQDLSSYLLNNYVTKNSALTITGAKTFQAPVSIESTLGVTGAATFTTPISGDILGNATTADRLKNSRTINGVAFDGSSNITITAAANGGTATNATTAATAKLLYYAELIASDYVNSSGTAITSGTKYHKVMTASNVGIPDLYKGLMIVMKMPTTGTPCTSCTVNIDSKGAKLIRWRDLLNNTYWTSGATYLFVYDGTYFVAMHSYDSNTDVRYQSTINYPTWTVSSTGAIRRYTLCMKTPDGKITSLTLTDNTQGTTKTMYSGPLLFDKVYYWNHTDNYEAGNSITRKNTMLELNGDLLDYRYTFNCGTTLSARSHIFIVGSIGSNGYFYLDPTTPWSCSYPTTDDGKIYIKVGTTYTDAAGYRGTLETVNTAYCYKNGSVSTYTNYASETSAKYYNLVNTTHSNLLDLKTNSKLIPGQLYRIIDYTFTTSQDGTQSANHQFDIIVVADSSNKLNETARACLHTGDTYFTNCNLQSWELKYCLENNSDRFGWAISTGKGVIYYMKDEFNNVAPYDFKNAMFNLKDVLGGSSTLIVSGPGGNNYSTNRYIYTFNSDLSVSTPTDLSLSDTFYVHDNYIGYNRNITSGGASSSACGGIAKVDGTVSFTTTEILYIPRNIFIGASTYSNVLGTNCCSNIFLGSNCNNIIRNNSYCNSFGGSSNNNIIGNNCYNNYLNYGSLNNILENNCHDNYFIGTYNTILYEDCTNNSIVYGHSNTLLQKCCYIELSNNTCNTLKNNSSNIVLGANSNYNSFGIMCSNISIGDNCLYNSFENHCNDISVGNYCNNNTFKNSCSYIYFGKNRSSIQGYFENITVESGNNFIYLYNSLSLSASYKMKNIIIGAGYNNDTAGNYKSISSSERNLTYETRYVRNNSKTLIMD